VKNGGNSQRFHDQIIPKTSKSSRETVSHLLATTSAPIDPTEKKVGPTQRWHCHNEDVGI
jgi:hypothetical protein